MIVIYIPGTHSSEIVALNNDDEENAYNSTNFTQDQNNNGFNKRKGKHEVWKRIHTCKCDI